MESGTKETESCIKRTRKERNRVDKDNLRKHISFSILAKRTTSWEY